MAIFALTERLPTSATLAFFTFLILVLNGGQLQKSPCTRYTVLFCAKCGTKICCNINLTLNPTSLQYDALEAHGPSSTFLQFCLKCLIFAELVGSQNRDIDRSFNTFQHQVLILLPAVPGPHRSMSPTLILSPS